MAGELRGSGRMAVLRLAADTAQVLGDVANGVVKPEAFQAARLDAASSSGGGDPEEVRPIQQLALRRVFRIQLPLA